MVDSIRNLICSSCMYCATPWPWMLMCHSLAGYEHPVDQVVNDLLVCLDNPTLAMLQWDEVFSVVEVSSL